MRMASIIIIASLSILGMIIMNIFCPSIKVGKFNLSTFWMGPLLGLIILLISNLLNLHDFFHGLTRSGSINPLEILGLFFSMTFMSIVLDEVGFFERIATIAAKRARGSQIALFLILYFLTSFLTIFTSNDIIIITFTPFIIFFTKEAKINPIPYLFSEFVGANTWSLLFIIGNPTNIYLGSSFNITFLDYLKVMYLPTIFSGVTSLVMMFLLFKKDLKKPIEVENHETKIKDKSILMIALISLSLSIVLMATSSYINLPMWLISIAMATLLIMIILIIALFHRGAFAVLKNSIKRLPYNLIPFILSMFGIVLAFESSGITSKLSLLFTNNYPILTFGITSFIIANLLNNIPMSILFSLIISHLAASFQLKALYSTIIGSNLGAFLTPFGALAGVMWGGILKRHEIKFSFLDFIKYGGIISIPSLLMALLGLAIVW